MSENEKENLEAAPVAEGTEEVPVEGVVEPVKVEEPTKDEVDAEPQKRFPTAKDNREAYLARKLEKANKELEELKSGLYLEEEEKPLTRVEAQEMLDEQRRALSSESMLQQFLGENPDFRKYEKVIRKHVNDPDYANIPIGFIASGIVGQRLDEEVNKRAKEKLEADIEASRTKSGGSSKRGVPGKKSVWDMSRDEFEQYQAEVLQRNRQ